jgi:hypothetical protein
MPKQCICIGTHVFTSVIPNLEGDIGVDPLFCVYKRKTQELVGIKQGCQYTPNYHAFSLHIEVIEGMGLFFLKDRTTPYYAKSQFFVPALVPFSFRRVAKDTVFLVDRQRFSLC